jgi:hypothetical protein
MTREYQTSRRAFLALAATGAPPPPCPGHEAEAQAVATNARIVIIGAGRGGHRAGQPPVERLEGAQITLIDPRAEHLYQPGLTLVAAGPEARRLRRLARPPTGCPMACADPRTRGRPSIPRRRPSRPRGARRSTTTSSSWRRA